MSREVVNPGSPHSIAAYDRAYGSAPVDVLTVGDGRPNSAGVATVLGDVKIGGRSMQGTPSIVATSAAASNTATLQLKDAFGNNLREVRRVYWWLSATAGATSVGTDVTGLTTTVTTGVLITAIAGMLTGDALTDANGVLVLTLADAAGATTRYANFVVDGKIYSSTAIVSPT